jgi:hypothetical protein
MRRLLVLLACAAAAVVPAFLGLMGNQSFSEEVAVRVPPQVVVAGQPVAPAAAVQPASSSGAEHRDAPRGAARDDRAAAVPRVAAASRRSGSGPRPTTGRVSTTPSDTPRAERGP